MFQKTWRNLCRPASAKLRGLIFGHALAVVSAVTPAARAQSWEAPLTISEAGQDAVNAQVGYVRVSTEHLAVWQRRDGSNWRIEVANSAGGAWGPGQIISDPGQDATHPQLAFMDASITRTVVWQRFDGVTWRIEAGQWVSGSWQPALAISDEGQDALSPQIAYVNYPSSMRTVVWERSDGITSRVQTVSWFGGITLPAVETISQAGGEATQPQIAYPNWATATRTAVWQERDGCNWRIRSADWLSGDWQPSEAISEAGQDAVNPQLAFHAGASQVRTAVWQRYDGANWRVQVSVWLTGSWQPVVTLSDAGHDAVEPQVAYAGSIAMVVWREFDGKHWRVKTSMRDLVTSIWALPTTLSEGGEDADQVTINVGQGFLCGSLAIAAWDRSDGSFRRIEAAARRTGESWGPAQIVSEPGGDAVRPRLAFGTNSTRATAVWQRFDGDNWLIQAADRPGVPCP